MGSQQPQSLTKTISTTNSTNIQMFLKQYNYICQLHDDQLGKLKIYRKSSYNFDYVSVLDKLVEESYVRHLLCFLGLASYAGKYSGNLNGNIRNGNKDKFGERNKMYDCNNYSEMWLKIFSCQLYTNQPKPTHSRIKFCQQYLTYTLQQYITEPPQSLLYSSSYQTGIAPQLLYIIQCIITAYDDLLRLYKENTFLVLYPMITCITNPGLVFVDVEGIVKFMAVPMFLMADFVNSIDQCMVRCCQWEMETGRSFVSVSEGKRGEEGLGKIQRVFTGRLKRLIKWINRQLHKKSGGKAYTDDTKTQQPFKYKTNTQSYKSQISSSPYQSYTLNQLQSISTLDQIRSYLTINKSLIPSHLQFCKSQQPQNRHPSSLSREKIRLQKTANSLKSFYKNNRTISNLSQNSYQVSTLQDNKNIVGNIMNEGRSVEKKQQRQRIEKRQVNQQFQRQSWLAQGQVQSQGYKQGTKMQEFNHGVRFQYL